MKFVRHSKLYSLRDLFIQKKKLMLPATTRKKQRMKNHQHTSLCMYVLWRSWRLVTLSRKESTPCDINTSLY